MENFVELLAPAGNFEKLKIAFYYGADAVYFAGNQYGLRAYAGNFSNEEIALASEYAHKLGKKVYVTLNIVAHEADFDNLKEYLKVLEDAKVDAVIVNDLGIMQFILENAKGLEIHVSTQANIMNSYSINFLERLGVKRIVLARELAFDEIQKIRNNISKDMQLEAFVHGAMCISHSGRCLLSNYMTKRDANKGACAQPCRWNYSITEKGGKGEQFDINEDKSGTYILNSKDLNMIKYINNFIDAGVCSLKIEGRMKSEYYVANVTNAYRRAIDKSCDIETLEKELIKSSHRKYTTGFYLNENDHTEIESSSPVQSCDFVAVVLENAKNGKVLVEMRNRFKVGDELEVLSPSDNFNKIIKLEKLTNLDGEDILDAKDVQQKLYIHTDVLLQKGDMLRK